MLILRKSCWIIICFLFSVPMLLHVHFHGENFLFQAVFGMPFILSLGLPAKWMLPMPWENSPPHQKKEKE